MENFVYRLLGWSLNCTSFELWEYQFNESGVNNNVLLFEKVDERADCRKIKLIGFKAVSDIVVGQEIVAQMKNPIFQLTPLTTLMYFVILR